MKTIITKTKITLLSLALISTACSKKQFSQFDLDNARIGGVASAQPSANRLALLKAQKDFARKARIATYIADTMQRAYVLQGILATTGSGLTYYQPALRRTLVDKWVDATKAAIKAAFGAPTNTDGAKLTFATQVRQAGQGKYNKVVIGLIKLNKKSTKEPKPSTRTKRSSTNNDTPPTEATGDSINHVDKSVTYTVGGHQFLFAKATNSSFALSTVHSVNNSPQFSVHPVKLTWKNGAKEELIADNLYTTSAILYAINDALTKAIDATQ